MDQQTPTTQPNIDTMDGSVGNNLMPVIASTNTSALSDLEHKVMHRYHDHANDPEFGYYSQQTTEQSFPMRLHYMLNDIEQDNLSHIASWMPHGRCESQSMLSSLGQLRCGLSLTVAIRLCSA